MTEPPIARLAPAQRRRVIVFGLLRAFIAAAVLVTFYFLVPLEWIDGLPVGVGLVVAGLILAGITVWQVLAIIRSPDPGIRAIEALAVIVPIYLLLFAAAYFLMEYNVGGSFSSPLTRLDALYFTVTVFATVGFGDIAATSATARALVTIQMVLNLIILGAGVRLLTLAVKHGREPKPEGSPAP